MTNESTLSQSVGDKVKKLREAKGMTQKELGILLDCSESLISYIEKGIRNAQPDQIEKMAKIFGVQVDYFSPTVSYFRCDKDQRVDGTSFFDDFLKYADQQINSSKKNEK